MTETATFAGGCFWCTEAIFKRLKGVSSVIPGYSGGQRENPTYEQIHSGATGHAESIQITFDPSVIPYDKLLDVFWHTHNPTTKDRQGADVGSEYRSIIFYHSPEQQEKAEASKVALQLSGLYTDPVVTEIVPFQAFYPAEKEHYNFYEKYRNSPYCVFVIDPKIQKLLKEFGNDVKENTKT
ncbi:MAG: peptide-methionine (S)-S-oxide reductase MsrA [Patescibacteria group bacterium]|nr:peptide-methionine (S)-S-oxide reductase MsrA [Patescibacteria group bacterium]MDE2589689.1 peptide-methionine (S)-S-oxide reductase MsrA [Patescibacteria group bacterium]